MYQQHFGLTHAPLGKHSTNLWSSPGLTKLKEGFHQLLQAPGIGLLTGEPGVGKTAALREITQSLNPHCTQVFYLSETQFTSFDVYRQLAWQLGLVPPHRFAQLWREIKNHLRERVEHKRHQPVLIIDEAQNLPSDFFSGLPSFLNFDFDVKDYLTIWLVGHPHLTNLIDRNIHAALASRIQVRCQLSPINDRDHFKQLIDHALKSAGCHTTLLSDSGIECLRLASQGKPRHAHRILVTGLQLATKQGLNHLPDDLIEQAIAQLKG
jgi:type II secretory pathway predicted ATPase ExeA